MFNKFENYGKIIKNSYPPVITKTVYFAYSENTKNCCLFPRVMTSVLRKGNIKNKPEDS
jgi:hypothetical protein